MPRCRRRSVSCLSYARFFFINTSTVENVSIQVKNKRYKHFKAYQLLYKVIVQLKQVKQELAFIESNSTQLVYYKQEILASVEYAKRSNVINYRAIINVPKGLSFNFSSIDLSLEDWSLLLSIPVSSPKVAMYSRLNYPWVPKCIYCLCTPST